MFRTALAFLAGILCLQQLPALPHPLWLGAAIVLPPVWMRFPGWRWLFALPAGFVWAWLFATLHIAALLPAGLEGRDVLVEGRILGIPARYGRATRFELAVDRMRADRGWQAADLRVRLGWYRQAPRLAAGERWRLRVRLKRPHGFRNAAGFDYEAWLHARGIGATGYVRAGPDNRRLRPAARAGIDPLRGRLDTRLAELFGSSETGGLVRALAVGVRNGMTERQWQVLRATGTAHLMAISGLHIGLVAGLAFALVRRLWVRIPVLNGCLAAPRAGVLAAILAAAGYALLAGLSVPTQRALVMVTIVAGATLSGRGTGLTGALGAALLGVLLLDPFAPLGGGFWLSFLAIAVLGFAMLGHRGRHPLQNWPRLQMAAFLGLAPVTLATFHQSPWTAPLANLAAIPWVSVVVVPAVLLGVALAPFSEVAAGMAWLFAGGALDMLWSWLTWLATLPGADALLPGPRFRAWPAALAALLLALGPARLPGRWLALPLLAPLVLARPASPPPGDFVFDLLDVGQGLAAVVRTHGHVLVFDTGPRYSRLDAGEAVLVPFLLGQGIRRVDRLVVSHGDLDHIGGARHLTERLPVYTVLTSVPERIDWRPSRRCRVGQQWNWDGVAFRVLAPAAGSRLQGNDRSCVMLVENRAGRRLLLSGDIERRGEADLVARYPAGLAVDVLVAPHHGSTTSSAPAFVSAVRPPLVLFATGYRNRYRFPSRKVLARYRAAGSDCLQTADSGRIRVLFRGRRLDLRTHAGRWARYWHRAHAGKPSEPLCGD